MPPTSIFIYSSINPRNHPSYISSIPAPCSKSQNSWDLPSSQNPPPLLPLVNLSSYKLERAFMILHFSKSSSDAFHFQAPRNIITNPIHCLTDGLVELPILETLLLIQHRRRQCCRCTNHLLCPTYGRNLIKLLYVYGCCC